MKKNANHSAGHIRGEKILDAVLLLLLVLLFVQCGVYMSRFTDIRRTSSTVPFDMRMLSASSAEGTAKLDPGLLAPEVIVIRTDGRCHALFHSAAVTEEIYGVVNECLAGSPAAEPIPVSPELWRESVQKDAVFVQYSSELPYQVVLAFSCARDENAPLPRQGETYIGVRELLLRPDDTGMLREVLVRGSSGTFRFSLDAELSYTDFADYPNMYSDLFCRVEMADSGTQMSLTALDALSVRAVHTARGVTTLLTGSEDFLRLMDFNPDKLNYHTEQNGSVVYVESHGILRTGENVLSYQASDRGGISLTSLGTEHGDIYSYLQASSELIERLERINGQYTGGDASLCLEKITSDGTVITLFFSFRCDNILLVREGEDYGLTLSFSGNKLTALQYHMCIVRRTLEARRVPLQNWYRKMLGGMENSPMRLVYSGEAQANSVTAQWTRYGGEFWEQGGEIPWDGQN